MTMKEPVGNGTFSPSHLERDIAFVEQFKRKTLQTVLNIARAQKVGIVVGNEAVGERPRHDLRAWGISVASL